MFNRAAVQENTVISFSKKNKLVHWKFVFIACYIWCILWFLIKYRNWIPTTESTWPGNSIFFQPFRETAPGRVGKAPEVRDSIPGIFITARLLWIHRIVIILLFQSSSILKHLDCEIKHYLSSYSVYGTVFTRRRIAPFTILPANLSKSCIWKYIIIPRRERS